MRLRIPHVVNILQKGRVVLWRRRELRVFASGAPLEVGKDRARAQIHDGRRVRVSGKRKEPRYAGGMMYRQVESDDGSVAPSDDCGLTYVQRIEHPYDVRSHDVVADLLRAARA